MPGGGDRRYLWSRDTGAETRASPVVADLTGDGLPEVVAAAYNGSVFVWSADGNLLPGWPQTPEPGVPIPGSPSVADLDGDGLSDILIAIRDKLYAWHADGTRVPGWPQPTNGSFVQTAPAIGDVDGDGAVEVVLNNGNRAVYAWHADGTLVPGWPKTTTRIEEFSTPALRDRIHGGDGPAPASAGCPRGS